MTAKEPIEKVKSVNIAEYIRDTKYIKRLCSKLFQKDSMLFD